MVSKGSGLWGPHLPDSRGRLCVARQLAARSSGLSNRIPPTGAGQDARERFWGPPGRHARVQCPGAEGRVVQVFSDRTITLELVDGARLDFPFESVEEQLTRELSPFEKVRRHAVVRVKDPCPQDLFKRFPKSDTLNYWNEEKATRAGKLAWVT